MALGFCHTVNPGTIGCCLIKRIQAPAERIGNNQVIGLVQFDQSATASA
jgi:hypothetical protein